MKKLFAGILASTMILSTASMALAQETTEEILEPQFTQTLYKSAGFDTTDVWPYYTVYAYKNSVVNSVLNTSLYSGQLHLFRVTSNSTLQTLEVGSKSANAQLSVQNSSALTTITLPSTFSLHFLDMKNCQNLTALVVPGYPEYDKAAGSKRFSDVSKWVDNCPNLVVYGVPGSGTEQCANDNNVPFRDIATYGQAAATYADWAKGYAEDAMERMMPDLTPENYTDPSNRGLAAQSFYNLFGNDTELVATHEFTDMGDFSDAVTWCHGAGVMSGTGRTTFGTYGNVNREQFCLVLKQMATILEKDTVDGDVSALGDFSDAWSISEWAQEGVAWAVANGIMAGGDGALNPHGDVTRIEVAIMVQALENL